MTPAIRPMHSAMPKFGVIDSDRTHTNNKGVTIFHGQIGQYAIVYQATPILPSLDTFRITAETAALSRNHQQEEVQLGEISTRTRDSRSTYFFKAHNVVFHPLIMADLNSILSHLSQPVQEPDTADVSATTQASKSTHRWKGQIAALVRSITHRPRLASAD